MRLDLHLSGRDPWARELLRVLQTRSSKPFDTACIPWICSRKRSRRLSGAWKQSAQMDFRSMNLARTIGYPLW